MRVVITGNGAAGSYAAFTVRELSKEADIKIFSAEVHPLYSPCVLHRYISGEVERGRVFLKSLDDYHRQNIGTFFGERVIKIDVKNKVVLSEKRSVPYDKLIIATGSRSVTPPIPGVNRKGVFFLKSLQEADAILAYPWHRAAVIGAGPIGVEVSESLKQRGGTVSLIVRSRIMRQLFDERPASLLQNHLEDSGIRVVSGEQVLEIQGNGAVRRLLTSSQAIDCDMVILATSVVPEVDLARQAGLEIGRLGGIKVNKQMLTSVPDVYACGDCVEVEDLLTHKPKLSLKWYDARIQAMIAGSNCAGKFREFPGSYEVTIVSAFGVDAVSLGSVESALRASGVDGLKIVEQVGHKHYSRFLIREGRVLGAQLIGHVEHSGSIFSTMVRRENIDNIRKLVADRNLAIIPLLRLINNYLGQ